MQELALHNVHVVLVEPRYQGNIGSAARAMKNMGLEKLDLVNPPALNFGEAEKMAYGAKEILYKANIYPNLNDALKGKAFAVGTTRRHGKSRGYFLEPKDAADRIVTEAARRPCAIVFGREDKGLTSDELAMCRFSSSIPTGEKHQSLNLAQAVMVYSYEMLLAAGTEHSQIKNNVAFACRNDVEKLYQHLKTTLAKSGFLNRGTPDAFMKRFRKIFDRAGLEDRDIRILHGICSQIDWMSDELKKARRDAE